MGWYKKLIPSRIRKSTATRRVPEGLWQKCDACGAMLYKPELEQNLYVCSKCHHMTRISARKRLDTFLDPDGRKELGTQIKPLDFLKFKDRIKYNDRLSQAQKQTGENDALIIMEGKLLGRLLVVAAFEFSFIGGSMGAVVGERFRRAVDHCIAKKLPLVCFATSGGARMQESLVSLFQMSKSAAMLEKLSAHRLPFISVLTDPTMGGVSASLAMLGDVIIAEPGALLGFAGPRVIKQTVRENLPEGFQRSEFLLEHGAIDMIVPRHELKDRIGSILSLLHVPLR